MKKEICTFIFLIATWSVKGQVDTSSSTEIHNAIISYQYKHRMDTLYFKQDAIKYAYSYNGGHNLSIGYNISKLDYMIDMPIPTNRIGPTLSVGCLFKNNNSYFSSSLGFSGHFYLLYANVDLNYYTDFNRNAFIFVLN